MFYFKLFIFFAAFIQIVAGQTDLAVHVALAAKEVNLLDILKTDLDTEAQNWKNTFFVKSYDTLLIFNVLINEGANPVNIASLGRDVSYCASHATQYITLCLEELRTLKELINVLNTDLGTSNLNNLKSNNNLLNDSISNLNMILYEINRVITNQIVTIVSSFEGLLNATYSRTAGIELAKESNIKSALDIVTAAYNLHLTHTNFNTQANKTLTANEVVISKLPTSVPKPWEQYLKKIN